MSNSNSSPNTRKRKRNNNNQNTFKQNAKQIKQTYQTFDYSKFINNTYINDKFMIVNNSIFIINSKNNSFFRKYKKMFDYAASQCFNKNFGNNNTKFSNVIPPNEIIQIYIKPDSNNDTFCMLTGFGIDNDIFHMRNYCKSNKSNKSYKCSEMLLDLKQFCKKAGYKFIDFQPDDELIEYYENLSAKIIEEDPSIIMRFDV